MVQVCKTRNEERARGVTVERAIAILNCFANLDTFITWMEEEEPEDPSTRFPELMNLTYRQLLNVQRMLQQFRDTERLVVRSSAGLAQGMHEGPPIYSPHQDPKQWAAAFPNARIIIADAVCVPVHMCVAGPWMHADYPVKCIIQPVFSETQAAVLTRASRNVHIRIPRFFTPPAAPEEWKGNDCWRQVVLWRWGDTMLAQAIFTFCIPYFISGEDTAVVMAGETLSTLLQGEVWGADSSLRRLIHNTMYLEIVGHTEAINDDLITKMVWYTPHGTIKMPRNITFRLCVTSLRTDMTACIRNMYTASQTRLELVPTITVLDPVSGMDTLEWAKHSLAEAFRGCEHAPEVSVMDTARGRRAIRLPADENTLFMRGAVDDDQVDMFHTLMSTLQDKVERVMADKPSMFETTILPFLQPATAEHVNLFPHQRASVQGFRSAVWEQNIPGAKGVLLNHDTGSGKTYTAAAIALEALWEGRVKWIVILCPKAVMDTWVRVLAQLTGCTVAQATAWTRRNLQPRKESADMKPAQALLSRFVIITPGAMTARGTHPIFTTRVQAGLAGAGAGGGAPAEAEAPALWTSMENMLWITKEGTICPQTSQTTELHAKARSQMRARVSRSIVNHDAEQEVLHTFCKNTQAEVVHASRHGTDLVPHWGILRGGAADMPPVDQFQEREERTGRMLFERNPAVPANYDVNPRRVVMDIWGFQRLSILDVQCADLTVGSIATSISRGEVPYGMSIPRVRLLAKLLEASPLACSLVANDSSPEAMKARHLAEKRLHMYILQQKDGAMLHTYPHPHPLAEAEAEGETESEEPGTPMDLDTEEEEVEELQPYTDAEVSEIVWVMAKAATLLCWQDICRIIPDGAQRQTFMLEPYLSGRCSMDEVGAQHVISAWLNSGAAESWSLKCVALDHGSVWVRLIHDGPAAVTLASSHTTDRAQDLASSPDEFMLIADECHIFRVRDNTEELSKQAHRFMQLAAWAHAVILSSATFIVNFPDELVRLADMVRPGFCTGIRWSDVQFRNNVMRPLQQAMAGLVSVHIHTYSTDFPTVRRTHFSVPMDRNQQEAHDILSNNKCSLRMHTTSTLPAAYLRGTAGSGESHSNAYQSRTRQIALCHFHTDALRRLQGGAGAGAGALSTLNRGIEGCVNMDDPVPIAKAITSLAADGPTPTAIYTPYIRSGLDPLVHAFRRLAEDVPEKYSVCILAPQIITPGVYAMKPDVVVSMYDVLPVGPAAPEGCEHTVVYIAALLGSINKRDAVECVNRWYKQPMYPNEKKVLIFTAAFGMGVRFPGTRQFHKVGQSWHDSDNKQLEGRLACMGSHAGLPVSEQELHVFHWLTIMHDCSRLSADQELTRHVMRKGRQSHYLRGALVTCSMESEMCDVDVEAECTVAPTVDDDGEGEEGEEVEDLLDDE